MKSLVEALSAPSGSRLETAVQRTDKSYKARREWLAWAVAAALSLLTLGVIWAYFALRPATDARVFKASIPPPEKSSFVQIAVSPDGRYLAFTAATGGNVQLWVRAFDAGEARPLADSQDAMLPFWSPDSRFIGFFADGRLKKVEATGGPVQKLCEMDGFPFGGVWSRSGVILFGQTMSGLLRISATGGEVTQVTTRDMSRQEMNHLYPTFLPDGRHFLYSMRRELRGGRGSLALRVPRREYYV
jgi:eukaryotic-like serine/threonine-protein kinase